MPLYGTKVPLPQPPNRESSLTSQVSCTPFVFIAVKTRAWTLKSFVSRTAGSLACTILVAARLLYLHRTPPSHSPPSPLLGPQARHSPSTEICSLGVLGRLSSAILDFYLCRHPSAPEAYCLFFNSSISLFRRAYPRAKCPRYAMWITHVAT